MDEIVATSTGGKQSAIEGLFTLVPPHALMAVSKTMKRGSKYGVENWHKIPIVTTQVGESVDVGELDHALEHCLNFLRGYGEPMEQLTHFAARALMALDQYIRDNKINLEEFKG